MPIISIIAAIGLNRELGRNNDLIWRIPDDLKRFKQLTSGHTVIMGRKTFESIPEKFRPLPNRINIIVSSTGNYNYENTFVCRGLEEAIQKAKEVEKEEIFIIGGGMIYNESMKYTDKLYLTLIKEMAEADIFFPEYHQFSNINHEENKKYNGLEYTWVDLTKKSFQ